MKEIDGWSKQALWDNLDGVEKERNNLIYLLNQALDIVCPNDCSSCMWNKYCENMN